MTEWTVTTLKEHFEALRVADQEALRNALNVANKAVDVLAESQKEKETTQGSYVGYIVGGLGVLVAIASLFFRKGP